MSAAGTPLICPRCGREIVPGSMVEFIGVDPEQQRIIAADDAIVVHATCPTEPDEGER